MTDHIDKYLLTCTKDIRTHLFGCTASAIFTLQSAKTGNRFTFQLRRERARFFFADVLSGPENEIDYRFIGSIKKVLHENRSRWVFNYSHRSDIDGDQPSVQVLDWFVERLNYSDPLQPTKVNFWYSGRCSVCGRLLTVPESIARGLGPKCAEKARGRL